MVFNKCAWIDSTSLYPWTDCWGNIQYDIVFKLWMLYLCHHFSSKWFNAVSKHILPLYSGPSIIRLPLRALLTTLQSMGPATREVVLSRRVCFWDIAKYQFVAYNYLERLFVVHDNDFSVHRNPVKLMSPLPLRRPCRLSHLPKVDSPTVLTLIGCPPSLKGALPDHQGLAISFISSILHS